MKVMEQMFHSFFLKHLTHVCRRQCLLYIYRCSNGDSYETSMPCQIALARTSRIFRRQGADVHSDVEISLAQAALGGTIRIKGVHDETELTVSRINLLHAYSCGNKNCTSLF